MTCLISAPEASIAHVGILCPADMLLGDFVGCLVSPRRSRTETATSSNQAFLLVLASLPSVAATSWSAESSTTVWTSSCMRSCFCPAAFSRSSCLNVSKSLLLFFISFLMFRFGKLVKAVARLQKSRLLQLILTVQNVSRFQDFRQRLLSQFLWGVAPVWEEDKKTFNNIPSCNF